MASEVLNNRYKLLAQQGSGGMAVIYKAVDQALGRTVAVKILRPSLTNDPSFLARFRNEARAVANLSHPNIVTVYDVGSEGQTHYIVMEFIEGQDLKKIIKTEGALNVERAVNLGIQICAGIGFAHRAGLVHADVKPQNILVTKEDIVKVTDFGIAQAFTDTQPIERQAVVWGSPHYFAPEQAKGEKPTPASDVYSIGIVLFEMLTGRLPYMGQTQQDLALAHIRERVPLVTEFNPNVPENLARIIYKTMSKEASQRYRMADQLGAILANYRERGSAYTVVGGQRPAAPTEPSPQPAPSQPAPQQPNWTPVGNNSQPQQWTPPPAAPQPSQPAPVWQQNNPPQQAGYPQSYVQGSGEAPPTQRYDLAPQAPSLPQGQPYPSPFGAQQNSGNSRTYYPQYPPQRPAEDLPPTFDVVTIALAVLAFVAVACLIPLYIAVFQTRFGG